MFTFSRSVGVYTSLPRPRFQSLSRSRKQSPFGSRYATTTSVPWYHHIPDANQKAEVLKFRHENYDALTPGQWSSMSDRWVRNDETVQCRVRKGLRYFTVRPLWVAIHVNDDQTSHLFFSFLPVDPSIEHHFLEDMEPHATYAAEWTFSTSDRDRRRWRNYFIGVCGHIGCLAHDTFWPNCIVHESRRMWNAFSLTQIGHFLADPTKERIEHHHIRILSLRSENRTNKNFRHKLLRERWGTSALLQNDIRI